MDYDIESIKNAILQFIQANQAWAPLIVGALAFCETMALVSILIPSTVILVGIGGLISAGALEFWPVWWGAFAGAVLGFSVSYWLGFVFGPRMLTTWPLNKNPGMIERGKDLFVRWGVGGVFAGHFFGPLRAVAPLAAGIAAMPHLLFQVANVPAAALWAYVIPKSGEIGGDAIGRAWDMLRSGSGL